MIRPAELIQRKRDGGELTSEELNELMLGYARDEVPDYQMAALCMAIFFRGLTSAETYAMTQAMIATGDTVDLRSALGRKVVDKHSTGGVGDKTSIAVGPIVAACGVPFGKMSGRGLGHTGGTLDKLESIPGFRVELRPSSSSRRSGRRAWRSSAQSADLVPADKKLYALRDVTATVDNDSLIAASIMSKKIAGGAEAIVLDVKVGDGAFMKTIEDARELAEAMLELGRRAGPRGGVPPHGHGSAARAGGRQRARDARGDRDRPRRRAGGLPRARPRGCSRIARALRSRRRRGRRRPAPCRRSPTAPRSRRTSAGSGPRAATQTKACSRRHRS